ncbi:MAG: hypothetical protein HYU67_12870 [Flavobacteriia bacterium]|nr:hypothetical protein [Flavobacteriia bacterium]
MKNIVFLTCLFAMIMVNGQNTTTKSEDMGRIVLAPYVPQQIDNMPVAARSMLANKINQIVSQNGLGGSAVNQRFIFTANVVVMSKDITATAPPMQAYSLDVTFYIGDGVDGTKFASHSVSLKGVGENETKAYIAALKNIKTNDPMYKSFLETGKTKIIDYYNSKCDFIIKQAETMANQKDFDGAIYTLVSVPEVCKACFDKCMSKSNEIFKKKIEFDCKTKLNEATNAWNANQSWDGAQIAGDLISQIDPDASCYKDAKALGQKIAAKIKEVDKREWDMKWEQEVGLQRDMIKAYRDVGVAYGNNQPNTITTYNISGWW